MKTTYKKYKRRSQCCNEHILRVIKYYKTENEEYRSVEFTCSKCNNLIPMTKSNRKRIWKLLNDYKLFKKQS